MTFKRLSEYFRDLEENASRLKITEILSRLFKECGLEEVDKICYLSLGRLLPAYSGLEFQMAEKMMIRAVAKALGLESGKVTQEYKRLGDLGEAAQELRQKFIGNKTQSLFENLRGQNKKKDLAILEVYGKLLEIARENGAGSVDRKIDKMAALIEDLDNLSVRYVTRIPLGKLRLGFSEMTILDALSWMTTGNKSLRVEFENGYSVLADIGEIAKRVKKDQGLKKIEPKTGTPVVSALSQRLGTVEEMLQKVGEGGPVALEPKYDGTRLQLHKSKNGVSIFTRNLENVTHMFPEIVEALIKEVKVKEVILDSEGVGVDPKTGRYIPFQETIKRKRKHNIAMVAGEIPIKCFVFDIMLVDGQNLIGTPFTKRRNILAKHLKPSNKIILLTEQIVTDQPEEIRQFHDYQIKRGLEGAMVKKLNAPYDPGRRGFTWVKYKQEESKKGGGLVDTVDCLVMGVYSGKGKRISFGVGTFLVGVKKGDRYLTVTKVGTGLTDEEFRQLKTMSNKLKVKDKPAEYEVDKNLTPDTWIKPGLVVEIQADNITESPLHAAGLAMRFPRLVRFRHDKSAEQVTTLKEVESLYRQQFGGEA